MSIDNLLSRLDKVKKTKTDSWMACCPAHSDRSASLSIRELDDGRLLLHCFAGCSVVDVVGAVGLSLDDLYPKQQVEGRPIKRPFYGTEALRGVWSSALTICAIAKELNATEEQMKKLTEHTGKIGAAMDACGL